MKMASHSGGWVITLSFVVALLLTMMPLPDWAANLRPEWVTLALIYWCMALPQRVGVGIAWILGLLLDVVRGSVLGQYALALAVVAFITHSIYQRLRLYPLWQQAIIVMMLVLLELLIVLWVKGIIGQTPGSWFYWLPAASSMVLWPWIFVLMRDLRRRLQVH